MKEGRGAITGTRDNYVTSWGNSQRGQQSSAGGTANVNLPVMFARSALGHYPVRPAAVTDGTSNTVFTAETLQGQTNDVRGAVWTLGAVFMSRLTPNRSRDFYGVIDPPGGGGDRLGEGFCVNDPAGSLPCVAVPYPFYDFYSASRSRHPAGVNVGLGDRSVRFIKYTIAAVTWIGLNSIAGGEVFSSD